MRGAVVVVFVCRVVCPVGERELFLAVSVDTVIAGCPLCSCRLWLWQRLRARRLWVVAVVQVVFVWGSVPFPGLSVGVHRVSWLVFPVEIRTR